MEEELFQNEDESTRLGGRALIVLRIAGIALCIAFTILFDQTISAPMWRPAAADASPHLIESRVVPTGAAPDATIPRADPAAHDSNPSGASPSQGEATPQPLGAAAIPQWLWARTSSLLDRARDALRADWGPLTGLWQ